MASVVDILTALALHHSRRSFFSLQSHLARVTVSSQTRKIFVFEPNVTHTHKNLSYTIESRNPLTALKKNFCAKSSTFGTPLMQALFQERKKALFVIQHIYSDMHMTKSVHFFGAWLGIFLTPATGSGRRYHCSTSHNAFADGAGPVRSRAGAGEGVSLRSALHSHHQPLSSPRNENMQSVSPHVSLPNFIILTDDVTSEL